jgi:MtrB/PioB family decaheme-associated outer membrane protein
MLLSQDTRTLFTGVGTGALAIDDAIQVQGQTSPGTLTDLFKTSSVEFVTKTRRHIGTGKFEYFPTEALTLRADYRKTDREGTIPFGGSFGHSSLVELPAPTNHGLSEFDGAAEWVRDPVLLRAGYNGSWFQNDVTSVIFDNPFRATDAPTASARGRLALAPSNSLIGVNGTGSVKLPHRSRITAHASVSMLKDAGDPLVPQTINSATSPAALPRATVDGEARISSLHVNLVSRPKPFLDLNVRYRSYDFDNETPEFALSERVSYDNAPATLSSPIHAEQFSIFRDTLDADVRWVRDGRTSAGIGYSRTTEDRTHRIFEATTDNQVRATFDTALRQWFSVRTRYEHARRRGEGIEQGIAELVAIGEQPGMRHFDIAARDRDRVTVLGTVTPVSFLSATASIAAGKDDYVQSLFGLRDNTHRVYTGSVDVVASERVGFGFSYSYEDDQALSRSRQANPGTQFDDPSRNWAADTSDRTHSVVFSADVSKIAERIDVRFSYDFNRGRARYTYVTGPVADRTLPEEVSVPTTLPTPVALPPTLSELQRGTVDGLYNLNARVAIGASYWYERYRVEDFTLDIDANPDLVRGQALLIGYLYRPFTANTGWVRIVYRW